MLPAWFNRNHRPSLEYVPSKLRDDQLNSDQLYSGRFRDPLTGGQAAIRKAETTVADLALGRLEAMCGTSGRSRVKPLGE